MEKHPKAKVLSKKETKKLFDKWSSPEYLEQRNKSYNAVNEAFKEQDKMWKYCGENNCSVDDLINAHKTLKTKEQ